MNLVVPISAGIIVTGLLLFFFKTFLRHREDTESRRKIAAKAILMVAGVALILVLGKSITSKWTALGLGAVLVGIIIAMMVIGMLIHPKLQPNMSSPEQKRRELISLLMVTSIAWIGIPGLLVLLPLTGLDPGISLAITAIPSLWFFWNAIIDD
ncbi:MAG: hypothetical protein AAB922_06300 [Patescibacteria group bacterium]